MIIINMIEIEIKNNGLTLEGPIGPILIWLKKKERKKEREKGRKLNINLWKYHNQSN